MTSMNKQLLKTFGNIADKAVLWQIQKSVIMAKVTYGYGLVYAVDEKAREMIRKQWKQAICKTYRLPISTPDDRIYRVTLQATPDQMARK